VLTLLLATRNAHKVGELRALLPGATCLDLRQFPDAPEVVEDAATFAGNAAKKASELARWLGSVDRASINLQPATVAVLADDSGLEVDALGGRPGVHSARFAALDSGRPGNSSDADNNAKLLRLLADVPMAQRTARFRCVLAVARIGTGRVPELFDGTCEGRIAFAPSGRGGFGYDPLFVPEGCHQSFAELGEAVKHGISHRARALAKLKDWLARCDPR
jgi:XTP/dITP diphosphohydrolase